MSLDELQRVMERALRDEAYRELLRESPDQALADYELTQEERATILGTSEARPGTESAS